MENVLPYMVYLTMTDKSNDYETNNLVAAFADKRVAQWFIDESDKMLKPSGNFEYRYWMKEA